ncbi:rhamnose-binding lectin-like isoform X2 [Sardina pilchardus]|uniref:rhamnose-binding lectin-like isoform X2 n=1 Tax=Sardina pilchardus TaxID=27697 RepID=UPI002E0EA97A
MATAIKLTLISLVICACSVGTEAKYSQGCEDQYVSLNCGSDVIDVQMASYGRTDRITCSDGRPCYQLTNTSCSAPSSLSEVKKRCDGRRSCTVKASSLIFSDPCAGIYKYLEVLYRCAPPGERSSQTCEGGEGRLECGSDVIQINEANYGRTDTTTCSSGRPARQLSNTSCSAPSTLPVIRERCEGRGSCAVQASNLIFSNPCPGIHKYLNVSYSCVPPESSQTCEGHHSRLECGSKVIQIQAANYGRTDGTTCADGLSPSQVNNTNCRSENTLSEMRDICDGRTSCVLRASGSVFSDPCPETSKYLNISYSCVPPKSSQTCEGQPSRLECGSKVIQIQAANYGRTDGTTCADGLSPSQVNNTNCRSEDTLFEMRELCQGKSSCVVNAANAELSNPCPATHKYLNISYSCTSFSKQTCEGRTARSMTITCGSNRFIKIHWANYGRTDATICPHRHISNTTCYSPKSLSVVRERCEGRVQCTIIVSNAFFSNPCPGTHKYLDVTYSCVPPISSQTCEGNSTTLDCGPDVIFIHTANYGRTDTHICSAGQSAEAVSNTNCRTSRTRTELQQECDGQHSCEVTASSSTFFDNCEDTYKYLDLSYTCKAPSSS